MKVAVQRETRHLVVKAQVVVADTAGAGLHHLLVQALDKFGILTANLTGFVDSFGLHPTTKWRQQLSEMVIESAELLSENLQAIIVIGNFS